MAISIRFMGAADTVTGSRYLVEAEGARRLRPLPGLPREDAERCLLQLTARSFGESFEPAPDVKATFTRAGHIIGSACLALQIRQTTVTFSGDVGRPNDPIMKPAAHLGPRLGSGLSPRHRQHPESS